MMFLSFPYPYILKSRQWSFLKLKLKNNIDAKTHLPWYNAKAKSSKRNIAWLCLSLVFFFISSKNIQVVIVISIWHMWLCLFTVIQTMISLLSVVYFTKVMFIFNINELIAVSSILRPFMCFAWIILFCSQNSCRGNKNEKINKIK